MDISARTSRRRLFGILATVTAGHAVVLLSSEREGPGSAQLKPEVAESRANAAVPANESPAAPASVALAEVSAPPLATAIAPPIGAAPPAATATSAAVPTVAASPTVAPTTSPIAVAPTAVSPPMAAVPPTTAPGPGYAYEGGAATSSAPTPAAPIAAAPPKPTELAKVAARQPTQTMPGGRNNYAPNAPLVPNLGKGFLVAGTVVNTTGTPLAKTRIQIWLNTARGGEREPSNRGSVITDELGKYRLETSPVVPVFGQPHVHIAYDDGKFGTLFLRPVLKTEKDPSITVDFVLGPSGAA